MFKITKKVEKVLTKTLMNVNHKPDNTIRLKRAIDNDKQYALVIDKIKKGDIQKTNAKGRVVFVVQYDLIPNIESITIDYQDGAFRIQSSTASK